MTSAPVILVVEDEPRNTALLEEILKPVGYRMIAVETLAQAKAWLADDVPDLILLDRHLPDGDGLELARTLKASGTTQAVPIALVSASVLPSDHAAATTAGCDAFITKPIRVGALLDEVARLLLSTERAHQ